MMILDQIKKTIKRYNLLEEKERVLVAYSGGLDSSGLLALLLELREEWDIEIFLGHFNHKLRQGAEEDEHFVRDMSRKFSLPLFVGSGDVQSHAKENGLTIEEAGRRLRYDFLKKAAVKIEETKVATGHTMTDQAETLLMRLMRGSGPRGLASIYPVVEGKIIRPLIELEREDIEDYLLKKKIPYRIDESNFDRRFFRNRIRWELIPYIRKNFEPRIVPQLAKLASILQEEEALLDKLGKEKAQRAILEKNDETILELGILTSFPLALKRRVVREFIARLKGDLRDVSFEDIESVLGLGKGKEFHLRKKIILRREEDRIFLKKKTSQEVRYEYMWDGKKPLEIKEIGLQFKGAELKLKCFAPLYFNDETHAYFDLANLSFPLLVRNRKEGDRYQPLGTPGQKKLKEIMRAKGIPLSERKNRPVFLCEEEIVWVLGLPVSEKHKISEKTRKIFAVKKL